MSSEEKTVYTIQDLFKYVTISPIDEPEYVFRGEGKLNPYPCTPKLLRNMATSIQACPLSGVNSEKARVDDWIKQVTLNENRSPLNNPDDDFEKIALAQHYGVSTRLLDWTLNPLVAVWFACEDDEFKNDDGYVYEAQPMVVDLTLRGPMGPFNTHDSERFSATTTNPYCFEYNEMISHHPPYKESHFFRPVMIPNERVLAQNSVFSIHPNNEPRIQSINTIKISNTRKVDLLSEFTAVPLTLKKKA